MNNIQDILIIGGIAAVFIVIIGLSLYQNKKRKDASWTGVVIDKAMQEHVDRDLNNRQSNDGGGVSLISFGNNRSDVAVTHSYSITVRPEGGETFNWSVSSGFYELVSIGDKLSKRPGTTTPEIIEKAATPAAK
ncbi:MAG: hypothetical protein QG649_452 [Patescibacteria group bacterium]|jgi:hypothetical protein|nr:hypothetical protein [Patescibacteria group bacterium]